MALLDNLLPADEFDVVETKIDAAIDTINNTLGGGATGEITRKVSGTDFDLEWVPQLKQKVVSFSAWNMDTDEVKLVAHGLTVSKIRSAEVFIFNDAQNQCAPIGLFAQFINSLPSGGFFISTSNVEMYRKAGGRFDAADYSGAGVRGYVVIHYAD